MSRAIKSLGPEYRVALGILDPTKEKILWGSYCGSINQAASVLARFVENSPIPTAQESPVLPLSKGLLIAQSSSYAASAREADSCRCDRPDRHAPAHVGTRTSHGHCPCFSVIEQLLAREDFATLRAFWKCPHLDSNQGPADYEGKLEGRRFKSFRKRRPFFCPPLPLVSTVSMLVRRVCVEFRWQRRRPPGSGATVVAFISVGP